MVVARSERDALLGDVDAPRYNGVGVGECALDGDGVRDGARTRATVRTRVIGWTVVAAIVAVAIVSKERRVDWEALGFKSASPYRRAPFWRGHGGKGRLLPPHPAKGEKDATRTYTMYDHCLTKEVKEWAYEKDFWNFAKKSGKVVVHDYNSPSFFDYHRGIEMKREELQDGLYAWRINATGNDWEFGFAMENAKGDYLYEIGKGSDNVPLAFTACSQRFGKFFNRNIQLERDASNISYVFGSCQRECPPNYVDSSYDNQPLSTNIPSDGTPIKLQEQRDARLVKPLTIMMHHETDDTSELTGLNPHLRVALQLDTSAPYTKQSVQWIAGGVDYFRKYLKMVKVRIYINTEGANTYAFIRILGAKRYKFGFNKGYDYEEKQNRDWRIFGHGSNQEYRGCTKVYCDPSRYDLTHFWNDAEANMPGLALRQMQYKNLVVGDSAPVDHSVTTQIDGIGGDNLLTWAARANTEGGHLLAAKGQWGPDLDVRRVIVKAGAICSKSTNMGNCMYGIAQSFNPGTAGSWHSRDWKLGAYTGPTKYRKQWVFAALVGYGWKMVRIEIYQENDALYAVTIDCANDHSQEASEYTSVNGDGLLNDLSQRYRNPSSAWLADAPTYPTGLRAYQNFNDTTNKILNLGALYYDLAGDMRPSLNGYEPIYTTLEIEEAMSDDSDEPNVTAS
jgi:hypothetical protein